MELHKSELLQLFKERNITASKTLGQNFLMDTNFLNYIVREGNLNPQDNVLEIGSGPGILTHLLAKQCKLVWAVEIDRRLSEISQQVYGNIPNIHFIRNNILDKSRENINPEIIDIITEKCGQEGVGGALKVISNLPYKTAVPIIIGLLESTLPIEMMLLMLQREIVQRLNARTGDSNYSYVSIICQYLAEIKTLKAVPPDVFWPKPEVYSSFIRITPSRRFSRQFLTPPQTDYYLLKRFLKLI
ncbi:MAG: 16S rRNA (adenine(1518)-N(6)/adenine(1519)-N(6))-dimethyltransferase RsmA, partial [Planctomycetota bacterium]|nr:16S rRNA (adenine(1518)-N(6)/adenine(1519)-N(6))-dimethyltransferase RsmA [Planctomycetota bacterium]